ncbi:hypothetical protein [Flaviaesturariibacter amylovorans]|uniref:Alanyl-tRNA synthetase n=1 Tax=Flaviaesturariibacter amylovorans TaxID=1084520 RepID=A0ABP8GTS2_9BACT
MSAPHPPNDDLDLQDPAPRPKSKFRTWLKRIGWIGFLFFLLKGIAWLIFFYFIKEKLAK